MKEALPPSHPGPITAPMTAPTDHSGEFAPHAGRAITPAVRQRLEALYVRGKACLERGDLEYAHDLLTQCVAGDPGSLVYLQTFRANVAKKHPNAAKKTSRFGGALGTKTGRGPVAKAAGKGDWAEAFSAGCHALKKDPVDLPVLRELAAGCGELDHAETRLYYLRWAMDIDLHDVETNRAAAAALGDAQHFDQAIACWQRVLKQKPGDEQANNAIARLSVEQTLHEGGYNHELLKGDGSAPDLPAVRVADLAAKSPPDADSPAAATPVPETPRDEAELTEAVEQSPGDLASANQLATLLIGQQQWDDALGVLRTAVSATTDHESEPFEQAEDLMLRVARLRFETAQHEAKQEKSKPLIAKAKQAAVLANEVEIEVFQGRAERAPSDMRNQFELGLRLKRGGRHRDAIKAFQAARGDKRRAAETQLHLGECFQHIEQFKLAASSYEAAIAALASEKDSASEETRKLALYRAGVLALGLGDLDRAESRLTELAGLDFGFRDVSDRLDSIAAMRKNT